MIPSGVGLKEGEEYTWAWKGDRAEQQSGAGPI